MREHVLPSGMVMRPATPGCQNATALRRERARRAGRRSGEVRRQLRQIRQEGGRRLVAQITRETFDRDYRAMCEREGIAFDQRGCNSTYVLYVALMTRYRVQGQGYQTTNAQTCAAMAARDRGRSRRTVQRLRRRLVAMGVVDFHHIKRSGRARRPGEMDSLRVVCLHLRRRRANDTLRSQSEPALKGRRLRRGKALSPPPSAADEIGRRCAAPGTDEKATDATGGGLPANDTPYATEAERRYAFLAMCEANAPALLSRDQAAELGELRARLDGSGQDTLRIRSSFSEEPR